MKATSLVSLILIFAASATFADSELPPLNPRQQMELKDKVAFCNWCHSGEQNGMAPSLNGQTPDYLKVQIENFIAEKRDNPNARDIMWNAVNNLDPALTPYLIDYFSNLKLNPRTNVDQKRVALGQQIYQNGVPAKNVLACTLCHGPAAMGNSVFPRLAGQNKYYIRGQFNDWKRGYRAYSAPMPDYAKALSDDEIKALAEYVTSL